VSGRVVVGKPEIAAMFHVKRQTPSQWKTRKQLPPPDHPPVNGGEAWYRDTILRWAVDEGRVGRLSADLRAEVERVSQ
jgi:hypothetical protein